MSKTGRRDNSSDQSGSRKILERLIRGSENMIREWWANAGGLEIKPSQLPSLVSRHAISPLEAAQAVLSGMKDFCSIDRVIIKLLKDRFSDEVDRILENADLYAKRIFSIRGLEVDFSKSIRWNWNPESKREEDSKEFYIYIRDSGRHEHWRTTFPGYFSRLQHLPALALAYSVTEDKKYLDALVDQTSNWFRHNPVGFGYAWSSTKDVAIRAANLAFSFGLIGYRNLKKEFAIDLVGNLIAHGRFIANNLEWSKEGNNSDYLAQIAGLAILSCIVGASVHESVNWRKFCRDEIVIETGKQVMSDGWHNERSSSMHVFAFECILLTSIFLKKAEEVLPESFFNKLSSMSMVLRDLIAPDFSIPAIGEGSSDAVIYTGALARRNLGSLLALAAAFLKESRVKIPGLGASLIVPVLLGPAVVKQFDSLPFFNPPLTAEYPEGGLFTLRSQDGASFLTFRTCQAVKHTDKHDDLLSITVWLKGKPIVIDSGTPAFISKKTNPDVFRAGMSHAMVCPIYPADPSSQIDCRVKWSGIETIRRESLDEGIIIEGVKKGCCSQGSGKLAIRRNINFHFPSGKIEIEDEIYPEDCESGLQFYWYFPLAHGLNTECSSTRCRIIDSKGEHLADLLFFPGWRIEVLDSSCASPDGEIFPNLSIRFLPPDGTLKGQFIIRPAS